MLSSANLKEKKKRLHISNTIDLTHIFTFGERKQNIHKSDGYKA